MADNGPETAEQARARGAAEEAASLARAAAEQARAQSEIERQRAERQDLNKDESDRPDEMDEEVPDKDSPAYVTYLEGEVERHRAAEARRQSASAAAQELANLGLQRTVDGLSIETRMKLYKRPEPYDQAKK